MIQPLDTLSGTMQPDTLIRHEEVLNPLWESPFSVLNSLPDRVPITAPTINPHLTVEEAFGPLSELVAREQEALPFVEQLTDHPIFQGIILLLLAAYALMVCGHLFDFLSLFSRNGDRDLRGGASGRALQTSAIIGLLLVVALVVRLCEGGPFASFGSMTLMLSALGCVTLLLLLQSGVMLLIGQITLTRDLSGELIRHKILLFGLGSLLASPALILLLLTPAETGKGWFGWTLLVGFLVVILFLKESFVLFMRKKISILHWFLYLCAVECFPVSLIWLLLIRW